MTNIFEYSNIFVTLCTKLNNWCSCLKIEKERESRKLLENMRNWRWVVGGMQLRETSVDQVSHENYILIRFHIKFLFSYWKFKFSYIKNLCGSGFTSFFLFSYWKFEVSYIGNLCGSGFTSNLYFLIGTHLTWPGFASNFYFLIKIEQYWPDITSNW